MIGIESTLWFSVYEKSLEITIKIGIDSSRGWRRTVARPIAIVTLRRRAAEQRDELEADHSITSSAATCSVSGTLRPSVFAVFRLITSSNLVGCRTGNSAGLSPLRIAPA